MPKINKLTGPQIARLPEYVERGLRIGLATGPCDRLACQKGAKLAYRLAGKKEPSVFVWLDSPHSGSIGAAMLVQVRDQVWAQVRDQVWAQVRDQVGKAARDGVNNDGISSLWAQWGAFISFFRDVCGWQDPILERFEIDEALMQSCGWTWWHQNVLAISDRPRAINRDTQGRLHCEDAPSIRYPDGWALYHIHGVCVPEHVVMRPTEITLSQIADEKNAEVRRVMVERYGEERYIVDSGMKSIARDDKYGELFVQNFDAGRPIAKLRVINRTPEPDGSSRIYWLPINPKHYNGDAGRIPQAAVASTWRTKPGGTELFFKDWRDYSPVLET